MAINLDRFNSSSHSNNNSKKPTLERILTDFFEPQPLDDTGSFPPQDDAPIAQWVHLSEDDASASADAVEVDSVETIRREVPAAGNEAKADHDREDERHEDPELVSNDAALEADGDPTPMQGEAPALEDEETVKAPEPDFDQTVAAPFSPTLVQQPVAPRRGSVPKFLADFEAGRGASDPDDTAMRPLPYYNFNWMREDRNAIRDDFETLDDGFDEGYEPRADEELDPRDGLDETLDDEYDEEYDDFYDDYEETERRRSRKPIAALVAAVAVISFIAGGITSRLSSQVPVLFGETAKSTDSQASYSETTTEQTAPDQAPPPEETTPQSDTEQQTQSQPTDSTSNPPSYDTGDDTTDDWGSNGYDQQQDYQQQYDSDNQDNSNDNVWQWNFDQDGNNSISYDQDDNLVTFEYDGYTISVPIGDLIGDNQHEVTHSPYNDYGTGYDTEENRDYEQWHYQPQSYSWS